MDEESVWNVLMRHTHYIPWLSQGSWSWDRAWEFETIEFQGPTWWAIAVDNPAWFWVMHRG